MEDWKSNIETQIYKESYNGILICGLNWGVTSKNNSEYKQNEKKYFSHKMYDYKFRNRILKWFDLWNIKIETEEDSIGSFEKCITYTNWLKTKSKDLKSDPTNELNSGNEQIYETINKLNPKIIILLSKNLMYELNSGEMIGRVTKTLGNYKEIEYLNENNIIKNSKLKRFLVLKQQIGNCTVYSFPHPTGSRGLRYDYIKLFKDEMKLCFSEFIKNNFK